MPTKTKPRRDKRRCIHFCGKEEGLTADHCGIIRGNFHWWGACMGARRCPNYAEPPVMQGENREGGQP